MEQPLTHNFRSDGQPLDLAAYEQAGGYQALRRALEEMAPADITAMVGDSHLRGRGGAGFPTGKKWSFVPMGEDAPHPKYLVVNADEMEPGTFKDRLLLEGNPHQLIEGMLISAYAVQADTAYIFLRRSYVKARQYLETAIAEAEAANYVGSDILGTGFNLNIHVHVSAGRYICGEETALLTSFEGKRALPRNKPPFPPVVGLFGKPTVTNNVETICNVPHIVAHGANWFRELSRTVNGGTKIFGISGRVKQTGGWELPMGVTIREILDDYAGGMADGYRFRGVIPGGGSTEFLVEEHLDVQMDFDATQQAGSRMGTGNMIILDDRTCPVGMVLNLMRFFARESCGWCTPCREGLPWIAATLSAIENGQGRTEDLDMLKRHTRLLGPGHTYCMLAPGAMEPLQSALNYFEDDFKAHIREKSCPWRQG
jgi:NADH-quinone oxidoreductase subunit F